MKVVLFDTNFLLLPELDGIDVFSELAKFVSGDHELATLSSVVHELERMQESQSRRGVAARIALSLLEKNKVRVYETGLKADESLLDFALARGNTVVCTNDGELKKQLRRNNVEVISPKGRKYLTLV